MIYMAKNWGEGGLRKMFKALVIDDQTLYDFYDEKMTIDRGKIRYLGGVSILC